MPIYECLNCEIEVKWEHNRTPTYKAKDKGRTYRYKKFSRLALVIKVHTSNVGSGV
jgi:hypothetical protein